VAARLVCPISIKLDRLQAAGDLEGVRETFMREGVRVPESVITASKASPKWPVMVEQARFTPREMAALTGWRFDPERYRALTKPVCFLVGRDTPADHHRRGYIAPLTAALPNFRVVELPGQQHNAHVSATAEFA
jgi:pimeloyl-ACP methyl ester carboxylesterase